MSKFLLEESQETREMLSHISQLLASNERANLELAFQLLASGGVPKSLYPQLTNTNEKILMCYSFQFYEVLNYSK